MTSAVLTHLRRELMQQVWLLLLDEDFMHAYVHGFEFELAEGEQYLGYPRFLSKSQDYPEK